METLTVNGKTFNIEKLLGKGKGGYSYLVNDGRNRFVIKQIHHEPCEYYAFGDKFAAELNDYKRLRDVGIRIPKMLDSDSKTERILKEYIDGETAAELVARNALPARYKDELLQMCAKLYAARLNIDYYPTNFIAAVDGLYYIDYECNEYSDKWNFENWGKQYWTSSSEKK